MAGGATSPAAAPSKGKLIVTIGALTVLAGAGGAVVGKLIATRLQATTPGIAAETPSTAVSYGDGVAVQELPAIVTNLADPVDMRVRLQVSIVFPKKGVENPAVLGAQVNDDLVAFMKTVSLKSLEGASGMQALRTDLADRAAVRSQGKVSEVIIETLVLQ